jgi:hypothetical protein
VVGHPHHEVHVVLDQEHRQLQLVTESPQEGSQLLHLLVVQPAGGLVEQQQARLRDERTSELDALHRSEREPGGSPTGN